VLLVFPTAASAALNWGGAVNLSASGQSASSPQVAALPGGQAIAVWIRNDDANNDERVQAAVRSSSNTWGTAQTLSPTGESNFEPQIATDPSGNAVAVWTCASCNPNKIKAAYRPAGGSFPNPATTPPQTISNPSFGALSPQVSMDSSGNTLAVWVADLAIDRINAASRPAGTASSFGPVETVSDAGQEAFEPQVAAEPAGEGVSVWTRSDGSNLRIQSANRVDTVGYARPTSATPTTVKFVPANRLCTSANSQHGAPLVAASCNPPVQSSDVLTVGTPDTPGGFAANMTGSFKMQVLGESPIVTTNGDQADVRYTVSITDVRCRATNTACPNGFGTDYTGKVLTTASLQITDQDNSSGPGTAQNTNVQIPLNCVATADSTIGASCNVTTTQDALIPQLVEEGKRGVWEVGQVQVKDAGPNGTGYGAGCPQTCGDGDEKVFLNQGFFVP
jgi:hypothetical protein